MTTVQASALSLENLSLGDIFLAGTGELLSLNYLIVWFLFGVFLVGSLAREGSRMLGVKGTCYDAAIVLGAYALTFVVSVSVTWVFSSQGASGAMAAPLEGFEVSPAMLVRLLGGGFVMAWAVWLLLLIFKEGAPDRRDTTFKEKDWPVSAYAALGVAFSLGGVWHPQGEVAALITLFMDTPEALRQGAWLSAFYSLGVVVPTALISLVLWLALHKLAGRLAAFAAGLVLLFGGLMIATGIIPLSS